MTTPQEKSHDRPGVVRRVPDGAGATSQSDLVSGTSA
jgi:hypothetical protein